MNLRDESSPQATTAAKYVVVDTGQSKCYDNTREISWPEPGEPFYGQDAQYNGTQFAFKDDGDGTVTDLNTGLMWQKTPDFNNKLTWADALAGAGSFELAGYHDWRLPAIKELYSLIDFSGHSFTSAETSVPYIDTDYFDFEYGNTSAGERFIDAQYWSSTAYVGTTMNGDATAFGVNFADGRIKGYPTQTGPGGNPMKEFVRYVCGNTNYGVNNFVDNGDGTITDQATGLMWMQADSGTTMNWQDALAYAENLQFAGYNDWRLPNAKELQSIVDYTRAPDATNPAQRGPAIDPIFYTTQTESWFWTSTTHLDGPDASWAAYIAFGRATGWMEQPPNSGHYVLLNVHGAGAQRSDPKSGDPGAYPHGHGPQGDVVRIYNYVRAVRGGLSENQDIAVTNVTADKITVIEGEEVIINATVENQGNHNETFNVTAYANTAIIDTFTDVNLTSGSSTTIPFTWNTSGFVEGNYTIGAAAEVVLGETDTADNTYTDGYVTIVKPAHDIAVINVSTILPLDASAVYPQGPRDSQPGWHVNITAVLENQGNETENFAVTAHYDKGTIGTQTVTLLPGENTTLTLAWNTTGVAPCRYNYTSKQYIPHTISIAILGETTLYDGAVTVRFPGDGSGPGDECDGVADIYDLTLLGLNWYMGYPGYDWRADWTGDGNADIFDLTLLGFCWYQQAQPA